jgi:N-acyl-D-amino-acid deacylase
MQYDIILRNGTLYDGSGAPPMTGDLAIQGDQIAAVGQLPEGAVGAVEVDVQGLAVAPGFINMLSWSPESLIEDGRSQSEIRQGVTLEVMGEGASMGPLNEAMKAEGPGSYMAQGDIKYAVEWTTLGEYLEWLEKRGVSCNIASFVGSSTLRIYTIGYEDRPPTDDEMRQMKDLLRQALEEGAMGMSAALIYPPAFYASTNELIALAEVLSEYDAMYISHIRSEGSTFLEALDEFLEIVAVAEVQGEIYHLKASGPSNWDKMDQAIARIEDARANGMRVSADMYTYPFSGTGLDACIPPWAHDGGHEALMARLKDPVTRARIKADMETPTTEWENMFVENGPDKILLAGFQQPHLKALQGKTLAEVMAERGSSSAADTLIDLLIEDDSRIFTMYFSMSEDNLRKQVALPWVSFCSDAESQAPEGVFLNTLPHPRAYGSFARLLAKYVREEKIIPLEEAVRRLTSFPAANLKISQRGLLQPGYFADVVVFDPATIQDHATPQNPHQYATGMKHVFVNGVQVLRDGEHTGAKPGRVVRGPGWQRQPFETQYPEPVRRLLTLGEHYDEAYREFGFTKAHIPDLIRMATDLRLHLADEKTPYVWAPMHAWRNLGQLRAVEAARPLTRLFSLSSLQVTLELPVVYAMIGAPAIPALRDHLANEYQFPLSRGLACACLRTIYNDTEPEIQGLIDGILVEQLLKFEQNPPLLNSLLIETLVSIESVLGEQAVQMAVASGRYQRDMLSDDVRKLIAMHDDDPDTDDDEDDEDRDDRQPGSAAPRAFVGPSQKADAKKKAKRKQAAQSRKQNRSKKKKR